MGAFLDRGGVVQAVDQRRQTKRVGEQNAFLPRRRADLADDVVFGSSGDLAVDIAPNDPECPIKGVPSIRFDMRLSRESAADKISGRVGADPSAILKPQAAAG